MGFFADHQVSLAALEHEVSSLSNKLADALRRGDTYKAKTDARLLALHAAQKAVDRKNRRIHSLLKQIVHLKTMDVLWSKKCEQMSDLIDPLARGYYKGGVEYDRVPETPAQKAGSGGR